MLADPRRSCVVLVNLTRAFPVGVADAFASRHSASMAQLSVGSEYLAVPRVVIGEYEETLLPCRFSGAAKRLDIETLALWRDTQFIDLLAQANITDVFLGGAFLEEEILVTALEGARRGYDIRILSDLSVARFETDRCLVFERVAHHGIVATTVGQALLEWSVSLDDPVIIRRIRQLLS